MHLKEIDRVGPGGDYFTSEQTLASMHEISDTDPMWSSMSLKVWEKQGNPTVENALIETTKDLYKKGEEFIGKQKR